MPRPLYHHLYPYGAPRPAPNEALSPWRLWSCFPSPELCEGLLNKDPLKRLQGTAVKVSPFFEGIDWDKVERRELHPPWVPDVGKDDLKYHDGSKKRGASKDTHHGVPSGEQQEGFDGFSFYASSKAGAAPAQNPQPSDAEKRYSMGGGIE